MIATINKPSQKGIKMTKSSRIFLHLGEMEVWEMPLCVFVKHTDIKYNFPHHSMKIYFNAF